MATRTTHILSKPGFIFGTDYQNGNGAPIAWSKVPASYDEGGVAGKGVLPAGTPVARTAAGFVPAADIDGVAITNLTQSGGTATATSTAHPYETGDYVTIVSAGGNYNGTFQVTKTGANTFTFPISGSPATDSGASTSRIKATGLLISQAREDSKVAAKSGYGILVGGVVYANLVPGLTDAIKADLASEGCGIRYETYQDSRI